MSEELKEVVDTINPTPEKETKTFAQDDVNNIVAKNVKEERARILRDLGIEDVEDAKVALKEFKKLQDSQKTELEKALETTKQKDDEILRLATMVKEHSTKEKLSKALKDMEIDEQYTGVINKLLDKSKITDDINDKDFQPFIKEAKTKVGIEKKKDVTPKSTSSYLQNKYKNNPYFKDWIRKG